MGEGYHTAPEKETLHPKSQFGRQILTRAPGWRRSTLADHSEQRRFCPARREFYLFRIANWLDASVLLDDQLCFCTGSPVPIGGNFDCESLPDPLLTTPGGWKLKAHRMGFQSDPAQVAADNL